MVFSLKLGSAETAWFPTKIRSVPELEAQIARQTGAATTTTRLRTVPDLTWPDLTPHAPRASPRFQIASQVPTPLQRNATTILAPQRLSSCHPSSPLPPLLSSLSSPISRLFLCVLANFQNRKEKPESRNNVTQEELRKHLISLSLSLSFSLSFKLKFQKWQ